MRDARLARIAGAQFNRFTRVQLHAAGFSKDAIHHHLGTGRLVIVEPGVLAIAPALDHDSKARWMAATLTHPRSLLSRLSAAAARGVLSFEGPLVTVTRPGDGGPRRHGNVRVHRSADIESDRDELDGIPITTVPRMLLDIAGEVSDRALARAVREAVRLHLITLYELGDALGRYRGRRGAGRLGLTVARYSGLPIERAKSGAEVRALELLRDAGLPRVQLNRKVAGEEADLIFPARKLIIEIDGGPFHLDIGADARKEAAWRGAGWTVRRIPSHDVYHQPRHLLDLATM